MGETEPVKEALDHLLDPLDLTASSREIVEDDGAAYSHVPLHAGMRRSRGSRDDVAAFFLRVRRSSRLLYRIPRLLLAWTALIVGLSALIWITFSFAGLR
jgi:hypothetical protein